MSKNKIQEFTKRASPDNWLKYAQELKCAAISMWQDKGQIIEGNSEKDTTDKRPSISRVFMLNCGLSIENLLKGYLIAHNPKLINEGKLKNKIKTHDLIKLSKLCPDLKFEDKEIELMEILSEAIPYWGRYPIPLHFNNLQKDKIASENIYNIYKTLFDKIFTETLNEIKDGWDAQNGVKYDKIGFIDIDSLRNKTAT